MKKIIVKLIKRNPFIYKKAILIHQKFILKKTARKKSLYKYICYTLNNIDELEKIKEHYDLIKKQNTKLVIIINNPNYNLQLHTLIEANPKIIFISYDYIEKYNKTLNLGNSIFIDYTKYPSDFISNLI